MWALMTFIISFLSKVLEKVVLAQVFSHLNSQNLISNFSQPIVLVTALKLLFWKLPMIFWLQWILVRFQCLLFLICCIWHYWPWYIISPFGHTFGFQGTTLAWFRSYLSDRIQSVYKWESILPSYHLLWHSSSFCTWANSFHPIHSTSFMCDW